MTQVSVSQQHTSTLLGWLEEFASIGTTAQGGLTRLGYSELEHRAQQKFVNLAQIEGLRVRMDAAGNIIARRAGKDNRLPAVACGSHLDTVINGGKYDGALGALASLDVVRQLNEARIVTDRPIEVIVFASEESSRFGVSTIGSKAMAGLLDVKAMADMRDNDGMTFAEAVKSQGLSLNDFTSCVRKSGELYAFIELHIEQGPVLLQAKHEIGLVTGIAAPTRFRLVLHGMSGHSGTTSMSMRHDALVAGAEIALAVERLVKDEERAQSVGTVGVFNVYPDTANTIPGQVEMVVEFRSVDAASKTRLVDGLRNVIADVEQRRGVGISSTLLSDESPVVLDEWIRKTTREACQAQNLSYLEMVSGAGHDAMNMAHICPVGMLFVPSVDGISHNPKEYTEAKDVLNGGRVLYETILRLAGGDDR